MALIDQEEALDALNTQAEEMSHWDKRWEEQRKGILTAVRIVSDIKPKQEIIHCKGCKCADDYCQCKYVTWWNKPDDYCSRAKKRGDTGG